MPLKRKQELQSKSVEGIRTSEFGGRREVQTWTGGDRSKVFGKDERNR